MHLSMRSQASLCCRPPPSFIAVVEIQHATHIRGMLLHAATRCSTLPLLFCSLHSADAAGASQQPHRVLQVLEGRTHTVGGVLSFLLSIACNHAANTAPAVQQWCWAHSAHPRYCSTAEMPCLQACCTLVKCMERRACKMRSHGQIHKQCHMQSVLAQQLRSVAVKLKCGCSSSANAAPLLKNHICTTSWCCVPLAAKHRYLPLVHAAATSGQ